MSEFVVVHGGGRGKFGPMAALFPLKTSLSVYVIEADMGAGMERYANKARETETKDGVSIRVVPGCLWRMHGDVVEFHENVLASCSSVFKRSKFADGLVRMSGNARDLLRWHDACEPKTTFNLPTTTLDHLVQIGEIETPDVISLDIQGSELNALIGGWDCLDHAVCVLTEAEFLPLYEGQPLIGDLQEMLWDKGFFLAGWTHEEQWYTETIYGRGFQAVTEAIFLKRVELCDFEQTMKLAYVSGAFEFYGHARDLCVAAMEDDHDAWEEFMARDTPLSHLVGSTFKSIDAIVTAPFTTH